MKRYSKLILILIPLIIAGCRRGGGSGSTSSVSDDSSTNPASQSVSGATISGSNNSNSASSTFSTEIIGVTKVATIATTGSTYQSRFGDGVSILNNEGTGEHASDFVTYFNENCEDPLLSEISGINVVSNTDTDKTIQEKDHLKIGSKTEGQSGELKLTFNYDVTNIEIKASAYYKSYKDWSTQEMTATVDTTAAILIDSTRTDLSTTEAAVPAPQVISKAYSQATKTITLSTDEVVEQDVGKRVFIDYIKITYIA